MHPLLTIAVKAARRAGTIIARASRDIDALAVSRKRPNDFVTEVDKAAEAAAIDIIRRSHADHAILAEESGSHGPDSEFTWIIDPLDGTTNFIHGFPQYAVSIAVKHKSILAHAVIYDPTRDELFTASRGHGAYLNDRRMRVSRRSRFQDALIGTGFQFREPAGMQEHLALTADLLPRVSGIRRAGAAALDLAYVACGRLDGFWESGLKPWDMAAGALLVQEAGGLVSDFSGESEYLAEGCIVGGNPKVFAQLLQVISRGVRAR
ncbi:MAG: inositol monophosphatase [Burkholderiales bacterium]|nr:inositol monophosphatase [Burkholderiales bacterium]